MGRPISKKLYDEQVWYYTPDDVLMPGAWVAGDSGWQPCFIVEQISSNSFMCKQAYPSSNPPLQSVCTLVPYTPTKPGEMMIRYSTAVPGSVYYNTEGYTAFIDDRTLGDFEGRVARWNMSGSSQEPDVMYLWSVGYFWGPTKL